MNQLQTEDQEFFSDELPIRLVHSDLESSPRHNGHRQLADSYTESLPESLMDLALEAAATKNPEILQSHYNGLLAQQRAEDIAAIFGEILSHPNKLLTLYSMAFASGMFAMEGASESELAKTCKVTKAAFSKRVIYYREECNLLSRGMKSDEARKAYSDDKSGAGHWKTQQRKANNNGVRVNE